jgi:maleylpyruvate isomerase
MGHDDAAIDQWARTTIEGGLAAYEQLLPAHMGPFSFGDTPTLADICLIPQLANARRFGVELKAQRILAIEDACLALEAFAPIPTTP